MLGLLGTFVGLVATLGGAVKTLEGTMELQAVRQGLTDPTEGLGLAFGTSVAGVAAFAMLGSMSTLSRRSRIVATQKLDLWLSKDFRVFSMIHEQKEIFTALQHQTRGVPEIVSKLDAVADSLSRLGATMTVQQALFHNAVQENHLDFITSIDRCLKQHLHETVRQTANVVQPVLQAALSGLKKEADHTIVGTVHYGVPVRIGILGENKAAAGA